MTSPIRLHCFGESGNAYKAALTLTFCGIDWEPVFVDYFNGGTRTPEFRALNVMGEVPLAETPDGLLTQSGVIQTWASETSGRLGGRTPAEKREVLRWILFDNHKVSSQAGPLRFMLNFLPEDKRPQGVPDWLEGRLRTALAVLETTLASRPFLAGDEITIADTACCGYLFYPEPFRFDRAEWPAIDAWLDRIAALPGWKAPYDMMPGRPSDRGL